MFSHRIEADENTNIEATISDLQIKLNRSDTDPATHALAIAEVTAILSQFVESGRKLAAMGSQFQGTRTIAGSGYRIVLSYAPAKSKSIWQRLLGR